MTHRSRGPVAVAVRLASALAFALLGGYALNKGSGFWNYAYAIGGAVAAFGSLVTAAMLTWASRSLTTIPLRRALQALTVTWASVPR